jgi:hypothetical protein
MGGNFLKQVQLRALAEAVNLAIAAEFQAFLKLHSELRDPNGRRRLHVKGWQRDRSIVTGAGVIVLKVPKIDDRLGGDKTPKLSFSSSICPKYRKVKLFLNVYLAWLYLEGLATGDFSEAREELLAGARPAVGKAVSRRINELWMEQSRRWHNRELSSHAPICVWTDMIDFCRRGTRKSNRLLVAAGLSRSGQLELLGLLSVAEVGPAAWAELLESVRSRGLEEMPRIFGAAGAQNVKRFFKRPLVGGYEPIDLSPSKIEACLENVPKGRRLLASIIAKEAGQADTRAAAMLHLNKMVTTFGQRSPKALATLLDVPLNKPSKKSTGASPETTSNTPPKTLPATRQG